MNNQEKLKKQVTQLVLALRASSSGKEEHRPRYIKYDQLMSADDRIVGRKKVILMTQGCSVPTCTMCPFTNENLYGHEQLADQHLLNQIKSVLGRMADEPNYEILALYNDGSFFAPAEISDSLRLEIASEVARTQVSQLVVESLPQFITRERINAFLDVLGNISLQVGVGLQSANTFVRGVCVNTSCSNKRFEDAIRILLSLQVEPKVYLMVKPPFLTEEEGVADVLNSIDYLASLGVYSATLCPTRISRNTLAWELYNAGLYSPPNLWSIVDILRMANPKVRLRIACVNLHSDDFESIPSTSCTKCHSNIISALEQFNLSNDIGSLPQDCSCRNQSAIDLIKGGHKLDIRELELRVQRYLDIVNGKYHMKTNEMAVEHSYQ